MERIMTINAWRERCFFQAFHRVFSLASCAEKPRRVAVNEGLTRAPLDALPGFSFEFFDSAFDLPSDWDHAAPAGDLFMQCDYLHTLEKYPPRNMTPGYLLFRGPGGPVGVACLQALPFQAGKSIQTINGGETNSGMEKLKTKLKASIASRLEFNLLVCGSLLLTGEHGFYFDPRQVNSTDALSLLAEALEKTCIHLESAGKPIHAVMIKDVFDEKRTNMSPLRGRHFHQVEFQPNMILHIPEAWKTFDDYLDALSSKYRVRARRAFKMKSRVFCRELTMGEINDHKELLFELYRHVASDADFNMIELHPSYLPGLKESLGERFHIYGYFLEGKMIGFYTTIENGRELEAHFLGLKAEDNRRFQLYLNMLFDIIRHGVEGGFSRIIFARTALEIKSSIGAEAHRMFCYLRHENSPLFNLFVPFLIGYLEPGYEWEARHPFGERFGV